MQRRAEPHVVRMFHIGEFRVLARTRPPDGQLRAQLARRWSGRGRGEAIGSHRWRVEGSFGGTHGLIDEERAVKFSSSRHYSRRYLCFWALT
jgi:hypothetical protein